MVNSFMGPHGMFFFFGTVTLVGAIFIALFVKETKGLTDLEKKSLYFPEDLKVTSSSTTAERTVENSEKFPQEDYQDIELEEGSNKKEIEEVHKFGEDGVQISQSIQ
jgi:hypothetical protein